MKNKLYTFDEVVVFINEGLLLSLAGDIKILEKLPKGNWIAGTTPYFMDEKGGQFNRKMIFVTHINIYDEFKIQHYDASNISQIVTNSYNNGYTIIIIPAFQEVHKSYAIQTEDLEGLYNNPIVGWIAGFDLFHPYPAKIFHGQEHVSFENKAIAIHIKLPDNLFAQIDIINIFKPNYHNDEIQFYESGFKVTRCLVNGKDTNFPKYIMDRGVNIDHPLIADYTGMPINVSIEELKDTSVSFFAPVFKNKTYHFPYYIPNYITEFEKRTKDLQDNSVFSCNCILNYFYGELAGKKINKITGPFVFGEIGYKLLNQTVVNLYISNV